MAFTINTNFVVKRLGSDTAFMNLRSGELYSLNETGTVIWSGLVANKPVDDIAREINRSYDVSIEQALQEVQKTVQELKNKKII